MNQAAKSRIYLATIAVLSLVIVAIGYKFILAGSTQMGDDGRVAIILEPGERALMLREMREFDAGLQLIADALSREDMPAVAKASRNLGSARAHDVPAAMMGKLPLEFKTLAFDTHRAFDAIAAERGGQRNPGARACAACRCLAEVCRVSRRLPSRGRE